MSVEIATWNTIRSKMAFPVPTSGRENECLTKSEILSIGGEKAIINGSYENNECVMIDDIPSSPIPDSIVLKDVICMRRGSINMDNITVNCTLEEESQGLRRFSLFNKKNEFQAYGYNDTSRMYIKNFVIKAYTTPEGVIQSLHSLEGYNSNGSLIPFTDISINGTIKYNLFSSTIVFCVDSFKFCTIMHKA